jgi:hypothetical protein
VRALFYIGVACAFYFALKHSVGDWGRSASVSPNIYFLYTSIAIALMLIFGTPYFGTKQPGSFFERGSYQGTFYVHLYPEAQAVTSYRVPASISAFVEGEYDQDDHYYSWREYWIRSAFMPPGGNIEFEDCRLELEQRVTCFDSRDRYWAVVLTSTPAH